MAAIGVARTEYHDVEQRTPKWHTIRRIIGGSSVGYETGLSVFKRPGAKDEGDDARRDAAFAHGNKYEPLSAGEFLRWLRTDDEDKKIFDARMLARWRGQTYDANPGYDVPLYPHPYFTHPDDSALFGVSLDMRGSVIDVEIKNPVSYLSLYRNYIQRVQAVYFAQVQWALAMRVRPAMFFVATSYEPTTGVHLGTVVWYITFAKDFFCGWLYPRARAAALAMFAGEPNPVSWANEKGAFEKSDVYGALLAAHCTRVYVWKNGSEIARAIREKNKR